MRLLSVLISVTAITACGSLKKEDKAAAPAATDDSAAIAHSATLSPVTIIRVPVGADGREANDKAEMRLSNDQAISTESAAASFSSAKAPDSVINELDASTSTESFHGFISCGRSYGNSYGNGYGNSYGNNYWTFYRPTYYNGGYNYQWNYANSYNNGGYNYYQYNSAYGNGYSGRGQVSPYTQAGSQYPQNSGAGYGQTGSQYPQNSGAGYGQTGSQYPTNSGAGYGQTGSQYPTNSGSVYGQTGSQYPQNYGSTQPTQPTTAGNTYGVRY